MNQYLKNLNEAELFPELVEYANLNQVPIIQYEALLLIKSLIRQIDAHKGMQILEIGTAISYSALHFASVDPLIQIDTIERNPLMIEEAKKNIDTYDQFHQVTLYSEDALTIDSNQLKKDYDLIFIDAGKAQSQKFFEKFQNLLKPRGFIITDNILFHGLVENCEEASPRLKPMVKKIDQYNCWLKTLPNFQTTFLSLGDGLAISQKVNNEDNCGNSK